MSETGGFFLVIRIQFPVAWVGDCLRGFLLRHEARAELAGVVADWAASVLPPSLPEAAEIKVMGTAPAWKCGSHYLKGSK